MSQYYPESQAEADYYGQQGPEPEPEKVCPRCGSPLRAWFTQQVFTSWVCTHQDCNYEDKKEDL